MGNALIGRRKPYDIAGPTPHSESGDWFEPGAKFDCDGMAPPNTTFRVKFMTASGGVLANLSVTSDAGDPQMGEPGSWSVVMERIAAWPVADDHKLRLYNANDAQPGIKYECETYEVRAEDP